MELGLVEGGNLKVEYQGGTPIRTKKNRTPHRNELIGHIAR